MDKPIEIGSIFQLKFPEKYSSLGFQHDYFIILSYWEPYYKIGCFWWSGKKEEWGGARFSDLTKEEINDIAVYIGSLRDLLKGY